MNHKRQVTGFWHMIRVVTLLGIVMPIYGEETTSDVQRAKQKYSFLVLVPETFLGRQQVPDPAGETEIIHRFRLHGYKVVDDPTLAIIRYSNEIERIWGGETNLARMYGTRFNAHFLVIGSAFSEFSRRINGFFSCRARLEARVIRTDFGEVPNITLGDVITAIGLESAAVDVSESIAAKRALKSVAADVADALLVEIDKLLGFKPTVIEKPQERPIRIAVIEFENKTKHYRVDTGALRDYLVAGLASAGVLEVVDRASMEQILKELGLSLSGLLDPETAAKVGKMLGADNVVTGTVRSKIKGRKTYIPIPLPFQFRKEYENKEKTIWIPIPFSIRIGYRIKTEVGLQVIEVASAKVFKAFNERAVKKTKSRVSEFDIRECAKKCVDELIKKMLPEARVAKVTGDYIYINAGRDKGVQISESFRVWREVGVIRCPETGKVIGKETRQIGTIRIVEVDKKLSKGVVVSKNQGETFKINDIAKSILQSSRPVSEHNNNEY